MMALSAARTAHAGNSGLQAGVARAERRVALMVVVMGLTFLLAWTPYSVMALIVAFGDPTLVTPGAAVVPAIFAKSSCMYNPIIYVGLNTQFRSAWSRLLCCREEEHTLAHGGQTTEKVSLTVFTEQSPQPESFKHRSHVAPLLPPLGALIACASKGIRKNHILHQATQLLPTRKGFTASCQGSLFLY
ncbi:pinopsin-like [Penaeus chinensis]|uniref:pinopsin-like n=1 Tax=Penaeus chinensis TaxID=139456 RepID=UPI001FB711EF|nr:pinopsin-like [Penaeus chinensis]